MHLFTRFSTPKCYDGILRCEPVSDRPSVCDPSGMIDLKTQIKLLLQSGEALDAYRRSHYPAQPEYDYPDGRVDDDLEEQAPMPPDDHDQLVSDVASQVLSYLHAAKQAKRKPSPAHEPAAKGGESAHADSEGAESATSVASGIIDQTASRPAAQ